ncbi:MAG: hypothetical protein LBC54_03115 [Bacteroidales bacterium OttesenSCG-928-I14]|jgi:cell fate regulator YaaT (PSP1 superfamily)|nr:hypothetical protein [Bacteroidales bacterium OttesenSCG-928-I14]
MNYHSYVRKQCVSLKNNYYEKQNQCNKFRVCDYLCDITDFQQNSNYIEAQFKNSRKEFYIDDKGLELKRGDVVVVECTHGYDIGVITLTGQLVLLQMKKRGRLNTEIKKIYRKANIIDVEKYEEIKSKEYQTMIRSRKIAKCLGLQMKISYVEYQGDGSKVIFYYVAEERVDFRQLIKDLAKIFHVRIEMKQIGVRQETGQIGGIGSCGREFCCASWMNNFTSVSTNVTQLQNIHFNTQKLTGQCSKLQCCLNYEIDTYTKIQNNFPSKKIPLLSQSGIYYCIKIDVLKNQMYYSTSINNPTNITVLSSERVSEVICMNKKGHKPIALETNKNR